MRLILACFFISFSSSAEILWQAAPVFSYAALPSGIEKQRHELGAGLSFDTYVWGNNNLVLGPGLKFAATLPLHTGNKFVRVSPYSFLVEPRFTIWFIFEKNNFRFSPFIGVSGFIGANYIIRRVANSRSSNTQLILALGPRLGMSYWLSHWGLECSYTPSFGTNKIRHEISLALGWRN